MKKIDLQFALSTVLLGMISSSYAGISFGDATADAGKLTISGYVRANYQDKDFGEAASEHKIRFDAAQLKLNYERGQLFAYAEYRCYQYDTLCDFSSLIDAYVGYHLNQTDQVVMGMQPIAFGPARFWGNSLYGSINTTAGLEDVHNLGLNYHFELPSATQFDVGYFATDAGHYQGSTRDSGRYTANYVSSNDSSKSDLQEKNMWVGRITQDISLGLTGLSTQVGGSYWTSEIENKTIAKTGRRNAWALFSTFNYGNLGLTLTGGKNDVTNKDSFDSAASLMGSYDSEYYVANKATYYTVDIGYAFKNVKQIGNITPYFMHSRYNKDQAGAQDSTRNILGVAIDHKQLSLVAEYIMSKNDPFIGGNQDSLALGDDGKWNKLLNLTLFYYF
ncbi:hypothetical protein [Acinetobacter courvalinii]|uniref:Porin domain-containing protein n=1 Tax=Acinetobacter courvalinii TaxID=280147 RepID=N9PYT3_9GAMM|nr:hypothetical protein [Acinetobacter courvalinii]ENX38663.1 hypothetical protein F888_01532 [Acinetobacter courvalinii]KAB0657629.1 hypothetical protein F7P77_07775 [Acinetobacter courvalinii]RSN82962.1 hypothetical protein EA770_05020 [Acinetobacter baumannii]GGH34891.1 hypothetical protein GCM10007354_17740 [Acinetobacter courvalinii]